MPWLERLKRGVLVYLALAAVLCTYLVLRTAVLGTTAGELALSGPDSRLFALVSESHIAKGDLEASVRARVAAREQAAALR